uniref:Uncharacterized protein n=1 Tax=Streptomyces sp. NBC_00003 TaxID=2903608 RepID=A0AAU2VFE8_9ACTN
MTFSIPQSGFPIGVLSPRLYDLRRHVVRRLSTSKQALPCTVFSWLLSPVMQSCPGSESESVMSPVPDFPHCCVMVVALQLTCVIAWWVPFHFRHLPVATFLMRKDRALASAGALATLSVAASATTLATTPDFQEILMETSRYLFV